MLQAIGTGAIRYEFVTPERERRALELFVRYDELPRLSLTDCTSFIVMFDLGIDTAFTGDEDFDKVNLGFRRLPGRNSAAGEKGEVSSARRSRGC